MAEAGARDVTGAGDEGVAEAPAAERRVVDDPDHERFREALYAEEAITRLDEHLTGCKGCRELADRLERMDRLQREAPIPKPSPTLLAEILAKTTDWGR